MSDNMKAVRRLEEIIDQDCSNLEIFSLDYDKAAILACQTFELNAHQFDALRMMVEDDSTRRQVGERLLDLVQALDVLMKWISRNCPRKPQEGGQVVEDARAIEIGQAAFEKANVHFAVEQMFMAIKPRIFVANVVSELPGEACLKFSYTNDTVAYFEIVNNLILGEYNLHKLKKKGKAERVFQKLFGTQRDLLASYRSVTAVDIDFDLPDEVQVAKYTVGQIKEVWYKVLREAWHADYRNREELIQNNSEFPSTFPMPSLAKLNETTWSFGVVDKETTLRLLNDLTYTGKEKGKQKYTSFITEPILELPDGSKYISPRSILYNVSSRNIISALNRTYPELANVDTTQKERLFAQDINAVVKHYPNLMVGKPVQLPNDLPDVDYSLYDSKTGTLVCFELKWITEPATGAEIVSKDEDINKGLNNQIPRYKAGIEADLVDFMEKAVGQDLPVKAIEYFVVTRISVGSGLFQDNEQHRVINIRMLKKALYDTSGDLLIATQGLTAGDYFPKEGVHFERSASELVVNGVRLIADGYRILGPYDLSTPDDQVLSIGGKDYNPDSLPKLEQIQTSPTTMVVRPRDSYRRTDESVPVRPNRAGRRRAERESQAADRASQVPKPTKKRKK